MQCRRTGYVLKKQKPEAVRLSGFGIFWACKTRRKAGIYTWIAGLRAANKTSIEQP
ncbi:hypothetical protein EV683_11716 [Crenobacter luteus]|nr:hypothetical protein EV683_11716 [Crenobacter luteus]